MRHGLVEVLAGLIHKLVLVVEFVFEVLELIHELAGPDRPATIIHLLIIITI